MITEQQIVDLGWEHFYRYGTYSNGGVKTYRLGCELFIIEFNGNNHNYSDGDTRLNDIHVKKMNGKNGDVSLYIGNLITIDELKTVLSDLNIQK